MKKVQKNFLITGGLLLAFLLFTAAVMNIDVRPIGPKHSCVGLASLNGFMLKTIGTHPLWYHITDWLGIAAILAALGFCILGLAQLIKRKSLLKVDTDIIILGILYFLVIAVYFFFEFNIVNYRPILMHGELEASFPSSHSMVVLSIMGTSILQFHRRINNRLLRHVCEITASFILTVTIIGRLISGVHWFTDITAGTLLGAVFIMLYYSLCNISWFTNQKRLPH